MNNILNLLYNKITSKFIRKQSLFITPDGRFVCSHGGKEYIADSPIDGLTNDKKWERKK